ncbi:MAG: hypothetical protein M9887_00975 [Chitinophagales bacterium]|nr:hypothetical protein [Chitinophagales bacterium]
MVITFKYKGNTYSEINLLSKLRSYRGSDIQGSKEYFNSVFSNLKESVANDNISLLYSIADKASLYKFQQMVENVYSKNSDRSDLYEDFNILLQTIHPEELKNVLKVIDKNPEKTKEKLKDVRRIYNSGNNVIKRKDDLSEDKLILAYIYEEYKNFIEGENYDTTFSELFKKSSSLLNFIFEETKDSSGLSNIYINVMHGRYNKVDSGRVEFF